jgi:Uma2 family endonuclease
VDTTSDRKARVYQDAGIPEIWYIDSANHVVHVDTRQSRGFVRASIEAGQLQSSALPGFWIDVEWLWTDALLNPRTCLDQILATQPALAEGSPG